MKMLNDIDKMPLFLPVSLLLQPTFSALKTVDWISLGTSNREKAFSRHRNSDLECQQCCFVKGLVTTK